MRTIFVSYSRSDAVEVGSLFDDLIGLGYDVWMDRQLSGGMMWWDEILRRIRDSDVFLYAATASSIESQACNRELKYALDLKKSILPMKIAEGLRENDLPGSIQMLHFLPYSKADRAALFGLAKALRSLPASPALPDPLPAAPSLPTSYLAELRELAELDGQLSFDSQTALLVKLREQRKNPQQSALVSDILKRLRKRRDLYSIIGEEIDDLLRSTLVEPVVPPPDPVMVLRPPWSSSVVAYALLHALGLFLLAGLCNVLDNSYSRRLAGFAVGFSVAATVVHGISLGYISPLPLKSCANWH